MKKILLSVLICLLFGFTCFTTFGCEKAATPEKVVASYDQVTKFYEQKNEIFGPNHQIYFGNAQTLVDSANTDYSVLLSKYSSIFTTSSSYIDEYMIHVSGLQAETQTKNVQNALQKLNIAISEYMKELKTFAIQHDYFAQRDFSDLENSKPFLQSYKIYLGKMVAKNVEVTNSLANVLEESKIYEVLKSEENAIIEDVVVIRKYIRAKLLPVYTRFLITETESNVSWTTSNKDTDASHRIDDAIANMQTSFTGDYQTTFIIGTTPNDSSIHNVVKLMDYCADFMTEANDFYKALEGLKIPILAKNYKNNLENYQKKNKLAEIYLEKIEQFINVSLKTFINEVYDLLF